MCSILMQYPRRIQVKTKTRAQRLPPTEQYRWAVSSTFVALSQHRNKPSMWAGWLVGWSVPRLLGCLVGSLYMFGVFNYNQSNSTRATCLASPPGNALGHMIMTHSFAMCRWALSSTFLALSQAAGGAFKYKKAGGGARGEASHEWCPQDYSIPLVSLDSVYQDAQYSCSTHVGFKLKQKQGRSASPQQNSIGGPYHPPLWRCHSTEANQACGLGG